MLFPEYEPTLNNATTTETTNIGKSLLFNFDTGDFVIKDGKIQTVGGVDALKQWIKKIILTEKNKYRIYEKIDDEDNEYGIYMTDLLSSDYSQSFIQAEIQREITDTLLKNEEIISINDFNFSRDKRALIVNFTVNSIYGEINEGVSF